MYDRNGDGFIDFEELRLIMEVVFQSRKMNIDESAMNALCKRTLRDLDPKNRCSVSFKQFEIVLFSLT